ncbi:hypothetical protein HK102_000470 [Quaeritorhiza haematococci]|nr:hypothetical protein HK102_000470 [Quaeritorhiza haematococci]
MARAPRNVQLVPGVSALSRSQAYKAKALFKRKKPAIPKKAKAAETHKTVPVGGDKNNKTRVVAVVKPPRFYPADDEAKPKVARKTHRPTQLRSTITPGTVLIVLSGRYRGKRVVFLKQLQSGLLLVTGPYKINGVPLRRINQAYVIATSTKVDISKVKIPENINDEYFKKEKESKKKATEEALFQQSLPKKETSAQRIKDQKSVDAGILKAVKAVPLLKAYLNASFALSKGQYPHAIKF